MKFVPELSVSINGVVGAGFSIEILGKLFKLQDLAVIDESTVVKRFQAVKSHHIETRVLLNHSSASRIVTTVHILVHDFNVDQYQINPAVAVEITSQIRGKIAFMGKADIIRKAPL